MENLINNNTVSTELTGQELRVWADGTTRFADEPAPHFMSDDYITVTDDTEVSEIIRFVGNKIAVDVIAEFHGLDI